MAAMTTATTRIAVTGSTFTSAVDSAHSATKPALIIQTSKVPDASNANVTTTAKVVYGTVDAEGLVVPSKVLFQVDTRHPKQGAAADWTAAKALFREYVASDEFDKHVDSQIPIG
jgi:hypothetical protein